MEVINKVWPEWKTEREIGKGSYGTVYKCFKENGGDKVYSAVKVISVPAIEHKESDLGSLRMTKDEYQAYYKEVADDFIKEIGFLKTLRGTDNIVEIYDAQIAEKESGLGWYILIRMELLTDFSTYSAEKDFSEKDVIKLGLDICNALAVCHKSRIIHRDIKPENIFVDSQGNFKLGDFGVAKQMEKTQASMSIKGTYSYMSPEVFTGKKCDSRSDLYSLALVMYKLLNNNRLPFIDKDKTVVRYSERQSAFERRIRGDSIPRITGISDDLNYVLLRACSFKIIDRQKSVEEFRKQLEILMRGGKIKRSVKRSVVRKISTLLISCLLTACVCFGAWYCVSVLDVFGEEDIINYEAPESVYVIGDGISEKCTSDGRYLFADEGDVTVYDSKTGKAIYNTADKVMGAYLAGDYISYCTTETVPGYYWAGYWYPETVKLNIYIDDIKNTEEEHEIITVNKFSGENPSIVHFDDDYIVCAVDSDRDDIRNYIVVDRLSGTVIKEHLYAVDVVFNADSDEKWIVNFSDMEADDDFAVLKLSNMAGTNTFSLAGIRPCCTDPDKLYLKDGEIYFFDDDADIIKTEIEDKTQSSNSSGYKSFVTVAELSDIGLDDAKDIVAFNDKYAVFVDENSDYKIVAYGEDKAIKVNIKKQYGRLVNFFADSELSNRLIVSFETDDGYSFYKIKDNGRLILLGEIKGDTDIIEINNGLVYSFSTKKNLKTYPVNNINDSDI